MGIFIDGFSREILGLPAESDEERQQRQPGDLWTRGVDEIYQEYLRLREQQQKRGE